MVWEGSWLPQATPFSPHSSGHAPQPQLLLGHTPSALAAPGQVLSPGSPRPQPISPGSLRPRPLSLGLFNPVLHQVLDTSPGCLALTCSILRQPLQPVGSHSRERGPSPMKGKGGKTQTPPNRERIHLITKMHRLCSLPSREQAAGRNHRGGPALGRGTLRAGTWA